jgi:hypothetical protein
MRGHRMLRRRAHSLLAIAAVVSAIALAGCAQKDLKAPCSAGEGVTSYAGEDECGPMRRINEPFDQLKLKQLEPGYLP